MSAKPNTNERKKPVLLGKIILVILIIGGVCFGVYWLNDTIRYVSTDDAIIDCDHVAVSSKLLGRIKSLAVAERDRVQIGQLLLQLDDADLRAQELQAESSLKYARENLRLTKVSLERAQDDFQRAKSLFTSGVNTKEQYNHATKSYETASAQYAIALAQVDTSSAQLDVIQTQLSNVRITAPINGFVAKLNYIQGDVVQPGQAILTVNDLSRIWVTANFEETKVRHIHNGARTDIYIDAYPGKAFKGHVSRIAAGIVPPSFTIGDFTKTTQRIPITIDFDYVPDALVLLPGMSVEVKIQSK
jgi:membrane fusion protein (multidrug efflux system)